MIQNSYFLALLALYIVVCQAGGPKSSHNEVYEGLLQKFSRLKLDGGKDGAAVSMTDVHALELLKSDESDEIEYPEVVGNPEPP